MSNRRGKNACHFIKKRAMYFLFILKNNIAIYGIDENEGGLLLDVLFLIIKKYR
jgi:hypothetical protein